MDYNNQPVRTLVDLSAKDRVTFGGTRKKAVFRVHLRHYNEKQEKEKTKNLTASFKDLFNCPDVDLEILSKKDPSVRITAATDVPTKDFHWADIGSRSINGKVLTEWLIHVRCNYGPEEIGRVYPQFFENNKQRRVKMMCHNLNTEHFREIGYFIGMHPQLTNRFQVITRIEKYIQNYFIVDEEIMVDVRARPYGLGDGENRVNTNVMFLTCGKDHINIVTRAAEAMSNKRLLSGKARFMPLDMWDKGVEHYKKMLNMRNSIINSLQHIAMINIHTPDLEKVMTATTNGKSVRAF